MVIGWVGPPPSQFRRLSPHQNQFYHQCRDKEVIDHWIPHNDNGKTLFEMVFFCEQCNVTKKDRNSFYVPMKIIKRTINIDKNIKERSIKNKTETIQEIDSIIKKLQQYKEKLN